MLTPGQMEEIPERFARIMSDMEMDIMTDVIMRIKKNGQITSTADYELLRMAEFTGFNADLTKYMHEALNLSDKQIANIYDDVIASDYVRDKTLYESCGKQLIPFKENEPLQNLISAVKEQTHDQIRNITQTTALQEKIGNTYRSTPTSDYFKDRLDDAVTKVMAGTNTLDQVIKETAHDMASRGMRTIDYSSGIARSVESVARAAVSTGLHQITGHIAEQNMEKLDTKFVEVSWHIGARNLGTGPMNHQEWQGKVYYYDKSNPMADIKVNGTLYQSLVKKTGYGSVEGLFGVNCRHTMWPFVLGVSTRLYTNEQLDDMNYKENQEKRYYGKEYDTYHAMQHMRALERYIRNTRKELKLLKSAGLTEDPDYLNMKAKWREANRQYKDFAKQMGLQEQRQRIYDI